MADAGDVYKKGDVMTALESDMKNMVEEKKKMMDPNHRNDDTESEEDSSDSEGGGKKDADHFFVSAIDVGSHFIDVPIEELVFNNFEGSLLA